ncbi:MAG: ATP synthase F0 subunit B [Polyangiaceae bacterium]|nr:ATP synthase F0 subunit B [Polyangiaceae bacterium]
MSSLGTLNDFADGSGASVHLGASNLLAAVNPDFDRSVLIQMALFAVLIVVLKPLLFDPMLKLFALREEKTDGAKADARRMQEKAADILIRYEGELQKTRAEANREREALRKETAELEGQILAEARAAAETITTEGRAKVSAELQALEKGLSSHTQALARSMTEQVLERGL